MRSHRFSSKFQDSHRWLSIVQSLTPLVLKKCEESNGFLYFPYLRHIETFRHVRREYSDGFFYLVIIRYSLEALDSFSCKRDIRTIDSLEHEFRVCGEYIAHHSLILLRSKGTSRVDEDSSFFQKRNARSEKIFLDDRFVTDISEGPEAVRSLIS